MVRVEREMVVVEQVRVGEARERVVVGRGMVEEEKEVEGRVEEGREVEGRVEEGREVEGREVEETEVVKEVREEKGWVVAEIQGQGAWVGACSSTSNRC
jgi:hypothetical protein